MAKEPGQEKSIHQLRQEVAHSRDRLGRDLSGLRYELDFPLKFRKSFQRQTAVWITAAIVLGVVVAVMPRGTKRVKVRAQKGEKEKEKLLGAGLAIAALKIGATLLKPTITRLLAETMSSYAGRAGRGRGS